MISASRNLAEQDFQALSVKCTDQKSLPSFTEVLTLTTLCAIYDQNKSAEDPNLFPKLLKDFHEVLTVEYIQALSSHLEQSIQLHYEQYQTPCVILEVGAGNGRLTHFLAKQLEESVSQEKFTIIASDLSTSSESFDNVEQSPYQDSLKNHNPQIVISSWMPSSEDWTSNFTESSALREYICIGVEMWGVVGTKETWKAKTGFEEKILTEAENFQFCILDTQRAAFGRSLSKTVSFIRKD